ncbi:MAG: hypothetical protein KC912_10995 [Proteobacteria bacterium]|nr:hypothetical protein [Pseudomonadota bacterium]
MALTLVGCPYMSSDQYESYRDNDQDGWGVDDDCDDTNPNVYPYAPDFRGDGCDADCGDEGNGEVDSDGDDWPDDGDCDADDPTVYPCAPEASETDGIDSDCDGYDTKRGDGCVAIDPDAVDGTPRLDATCQPVVVAG